MQSTDKIFLGLTDPEAQKQLQKFGFNEPVTNHQASAIIRFLRLFAEPLIAIFAISGSFRFCAFAIFLFRFSRWGNSNLFTVG